MSPSTVYASGAGASRRPVELVKCVPVNEHAIANAKYIIEIVTIHIPMTKTVLPQWGDSTVSVSPICDDRDRSTGPGLIRRKSCVVGVGLSNDFQIFHCFPHFASLRRGRNLPCLSSGSVQSVRSVLRRPLTQTAISAYNIGYRKGGAAAE